MFLKKAALRRVPEYAVVQEDAIDHVEQSLGDDGDEALQEALDRGYRDLDRKQPWLARWLAEEVASRQDELAQSLGYFLAVTVYLAFQEAFPTRLHEVDEGGLRMALETLQADEELRAADPTEIFDSDDVVAMGQPAVLAFIQHHFEHAMEQAGEGADLKELDIAYRAILVEVIALSHAIASPSGDKGPLSTMLA